MKRRSLWKGIFIDASLSKTRRGEIAMDEWKGGHKSVCNKVWSRRSSILPDFVGSLVRIHNGQTFIRCQITEGKVGHKSGEFALSRKRKPLITGKGKEKRREEGEEGGNKRKGLAADAAPKKSDVRKI